MAKGSGLLILGGVGALAYFTRASWLPTAEADFPSLFPTATGATGATGNDPTAPTASTANQPITINTPGAVPLGTQGCFSYSNGTGGSTIINCPPGISPPTAAAPASNCAAGFTQDAAGICTRYPDSYLLANLNSIPWTGLADIPSEQIMRIDPQILSMYSTTTGVNAGTALAYMLGLGANPADGTVLNGSDGNAYKALGGVFYKQGTATTSTVNGIRMGRLGALTAALPITQATLILASSDPKIAALVGRDQRAMLTAAQWNNYYTQATGVVQGIPLHPADMQGALMSAEQYQARRAAAGLQTVSNLGTLRPARRGAFPLGSVPQALRGLHALGLINQWVPPGNRTVYQIPGRGAVPAGRGGKVPPRKLGLIEDGGGDHRWARSPFPRPSWWRESE
jgi:hypothetical protein